MIIYKITNKLNGKIYVGQTIRSLQERWRCHQCSEACTHLHRAIKKYGVENFIVEQIDVATNREELNLKEQYWIEHYNCISPNGYNLQNGGKHFNVSAETRERLSVALTGRKLSEETKRKIGVASKSRKPPMLRKRQSEHQKEKCRFSNPNRKSVICVETGHVYLSLSQAAKENGTHRSHIAEVLNGKRKSAGGYKWEMAK
jgi:group I intron endonuclease